MTRKEWARRKRRESFAKRHPLLAARVYYRDRGCCHWCGWPLSEGFHFDHVVQRAHGGRDSLANVVLACPRCNCRRNAPRGMRGGMPRAQPKKSTKKPTPKKAAAKTKAPKKAAKTSRPKAKPPVKAKPRKVPVAKAAPNPSVGGDARLDDGE